MENSIVMVTGGFRRSMIVTNTLGYEEKTPNDEDF